MNESEFDRHAEQLGKLVTLGLRWARVLQEDKGNAELTFGFWVRAARLAAKVEGFIVGETTLKWVWDTICNAPGTESIFIVPRQEHPAPAAPVTQPKAAEDDPSQISPSPTDGLSEPTRSLFEALRRWRAVKARKLGFPRFLITQNKTLIELAEHRPQTSEELNALEGISRRFSARYGEEIVQLITDWCSWNIEEAERPVVNPNSDSPADESYAKRTLEDHEPPDDEPGVELDTDSSIPVVTCQHCGNRIDPERIEVFPDAKYCVTCQEIADKNHDVVVVAPPTCPRCEHKGIHSKLVYRHARDPEIKGCFLGCSRYPHCQYVER
jgi:hypothetical protein